MNPYRILSAAVVTGLLFGCAQPAAQTSTLRNAPAPAVAAADPSGGLTIARIRSLGVESRRGTVSTYFTPGYTERAVKLQRMMEEGAHFFADSLQLRAEINLAVLDASDWAKLTPVPYGIPFFSAASATIFLPATLDGPIVDDYLAHRPNYSAASQEKIQASGLSFEEGAREMVDLIGYHELGHLYTRAFGIQPPSPWVGEFLATYFAYAFLRRKHPELASLWDGIVVLPASVRPQHTSLDDFNRLYFGVGPENYFWYQGTFAARVTEVFSAQGLEFLSAVREAFPAGKDEQLSGREVLERLDRIHPGFLAWAASLDGKP